MRKHHVVIIGSGFGGLFAAKALRRADVDVTLIARTTHHLFQPLLYQVATGILSEGEIAPATREVLRKNKNVTVQLGLVEGIDVEARQVRWRFHGLEQVTGYDSLIVAAGAGQSYFGNDHFARYAPGMKTIDDALELRARIFGAFELAELAPEGEDVSRFLTFAVVGAGPTGVEMAGQIRELASKTLVGEFRRIDTRQARVILIEGGPLVLPSFGEDLGGSARRSLEKRGVEVWTETMVTEVDSRGFTVKRKDGSTERVESVCKVWAAGVSANPLGPQLAEQTGAETDRVGQGTAGPDPAGPSRGVRDRRPGRRRRGARGGAGRDPRRQVCGQRHPWPAGREPPGSPVQVQGQGVDGDDLPVLRRRQRREGQVLGLPGLGGVAGAAPALHRGLQAADVDAAALVRQLPDPWPVGAGHDEPADGWPPSPGETRRGDQRPSASRSGLGILGGPGRDA